MKKEEIQEKMNCILDLIYKLCDMFGVSIAFDKKNGEAVLIDNETGEMFSIVQEDNTNG